MIIAALILAATPHFVTPEMTLRNGLTDAQYEKLWAMGRNPRIDRQTARDWVFRSSRFANVTNWLGIIGKTNDFARLVVPTMTTNEWLVATNAALSATVDRQRRRIAVLKDRVESLSGELAEAERIVFELDTEMTNGVYAIEKTDRFYEEREKSAPDEKLRTIYHEMRDYLAIIKREFQTPPNKEN